MAFLRVCTPIAMLVAATQAGRVSDDDTPFAEEAHPGMWAAQASEAVDASEEEMRRILGETAGGLTEVADGTDESAPQQHHWTTEEEAFIKNPDLVVHDRINLAVVAHGALLFAGVGAAAMVTLSKCRSPEASPQPEASQLNAETSEHDSQVQAAKQEQEQ
eukprot:TRINITY_DN112658_c0_g1_i1.p2 TRINITY_DN112658_c0_g1~~TRINITY_DN112658_c0_g1_i1.p2  ORF type:complete len:161 (+),score=53.60 TRINITY_DN112658_c0_g1_i1:108-590(+)